MISSSNSEGRIRAIQKGVVLVFVLVFFSPTFIFQNYYKQNVIISQILAPSSQIPSTHERDDESIPRAAPTDTRPSRQDELLARLFIPITHRGLLATRELEYVWFLTRNLRELYGLIQAFDPIRLQQMAQYFLLIGEKMIPLAGEAFTRNVTGVDREMLRDFEDEIYDQLYRVNDRIILTLFRASELDNTQLVETVLKAQRDFLAMTQVIEGFLKGGLKQISFKEPKNSSTRIYTYTWKPAYKFMNNKIMAKIGRRAALPEVKEIRLVCRPYKDDGKFPAQAAIRITIIPLPSSNLSAKLSFRLDLEDTVIPPVASLDFDSDAFRNLCELDPDEFPLGYHYSLVSERFNFADPYFFSRLVKGFDPSQTSSFKPSPLEFSL